MGQITMFGLSDKQSVVEMLRKQALLSGGASLVLRLRCGNVENVDSNRPKNSSYFGETCVTQKRDVMGYENKDMVWIVDDAADGQYHVEYVLIFTDKVVISLKSTAPIAYPVYAVVINFTNAS